MCEVFQIRIAQLEKAQESSRKLLKTLLPLMTLKEKKLELNEIQTTLAAEQNALMEKNQKHSEENEKA